MTPPLWLRQYADMVPIAAVLIYSLVEIYTAGLKRSTFYKVFVRPESRMDLVYFLVEITPWIYKTLLNFLTFFLVSDIYGFFHRHFSLNLLGFVDNEYLRFAIAFVVYDFVAFFRHYCVHRIEFMWHFHKIHHTPNTLNILVNYREHPVSNFFKTFCGMLPMVLLGINSKNFLLIYLFREIWVLTHHSNIRIRLGPLKYFIATPQFHWRHHHLNGDERPYNIGSFLTVWDYLFGTYQFMPATTRMEDFKMGIQEVPGENFNYLYSLIFPYLDLWKRSGIFPRALKKVDSFFPSTPGREPAPEANPSFSEKDTA